VRPSKELADAVPNAVDVAAGARPLLDSDTGEETSSAVALDPKGAAPRAPRDSAVAAPNRRGGKPRRKKR